MNWLKENWLKSCLLVAIFFAISGAFYWFQWRPTQIKKMCSWVEKHTVAVDELTQKQIDQAKIDYNKCAKEHPIYY